MIFVKTCSLIFFILGIHCVSSDSYRDKFRIKRLVSNNQTIVETKDVERDLQTSKVPKVTDLPMSFHTESSLTTDNAKENIKTTSSPIRKSKKIDSASFKSNAASDFQIPVQVSYDPTPETSISHQSAHPNIRPNGQRYRKIRRRKPQNRQFNESKSHPSTESPVITTENTNAVKETTHMPIKSARKLEINSQTTPKTVKKIRERDPVVPIIDSENRVYSHKGEFHYSYESGDGTKAFERSEVKKVDEPLNSAVVGGFSYTDKEGNDFSLSYTADENGYHPVGAHLPTPPPIPPAIARALLYLATKPTPDPDTVTGKYSDY